ncbi:MAG: hypothetical protein EAZ99_00490 [Alphaproteobacteria bacterium]|nr:MAG: hypothetical protein EAZ99_00490 [Alphaproteobacteria bacterium]
MAETQSVARPSETLRTRPQTTPDIQSAAPLHTTALGQSADPAGFTVPAARGVMGLAGPLVPVVTATLIATVIGVLVGILALGTAIAGSAGWMIGAVVFGVVAAVVAGAVAAEASQPVSRFWAQR